MMKQTIISDKAPEAIGPYTHANTYGDLVFTSGQIPLVRESGTVIEGGITEQSEQVFKNLGYVLEASGANFNTVLKTTCYLANISDFAAFNEVYKSYFQSDCPARSCFAVKDLPMGVLVEVEAIAHKA